MLLHHVSLLWVIQLHVPFILKHAFEGLLQVIVRLLVVQGDDEPDQSFRFVVKILLSAKLNVLHRRKSRLIPRQILPEEVNLAERLERLFKLFTLCNYFISL